MGHEPSTLQVQADADDRARTSLPPANQPGFFGTHNELAESSTGSFVTDDKLPESSTGSSGTDRELPDTNSCTSSLKTAMFYGRRKRTPSRPYSPPAASRMGRK